MLANNYFENGYFIRKYEIVVYFVLNVFKYEQAKMVFIEYFE